MNDREQRLRGGIVRAVVGGAYEVELEDGGLVEASLRGRFKKHEKSGEKIVAGDRVRVAIAHDGSATIDVLEPRTSVLARRAPGRGGHFAKPIVANADLVIPVFAAAQPEPRLRMLDRFLVLAEANDLPAVIVVNKVDLTGEAAARERFGAYQRAGYEVVLASATQGLGLDAIRRRVCGSTSVFTGPSGVGKSSLLNALQPGLGLRTAAISAAVGKGRHTTVSAQLVPLDCGGYLADTPGLRELGLWGIEPESLDACFPELRPFLELCRFGRGCTHTHEPGCAVRDAVESGDVDAERYASYRALFAGDDSGPEAG